MNKHRCPVCNKFMERDTPLLKSGFVIFRCPDRCKQEKFVRDGIVLKKMFVPVEVIDYDATKKEWNLIDKQNEIGDYAEDKNNPYPV